MTFRFLNKSLAPATLIRRWSAVTAITAMATALHADVLDQVDPFIGTGFHGHTFPGATTPFGMVQLSPDTRTSGWDACGGYYDADTEIWGFSHTHLSGTGIGDYGDVLMMPFTGNVGIGSGTPDKPDYAYRSAFKKENQSASPGYYPRAAGPLSDQGGTLRHATRGHPSLHLPAGGQGRRGHRPETQHPEPPDA